MTKVMFVCTGNICRSAMAHKLLEKKLCEKEVKDIQVYSCGLFAEDGEEATDNTKSVMQEYGVDMKNHIACHVANSDIEEMDVILCATISHKISVLQQYPNLNGKVYTMKEFVNYAREDWDIADPWGFDIHTYRNCAAEINHVLDLLLQKLA